MTTRVDGTSGVWRRHSGLWLGTIVAVGAALRLIALGYKSFWIDEIASVSIAQRPSPAFWHFLWHDEGNMALYYVLLRPWLHLGRSEAIVRLLSALPGVLSIPLLYLLARRLFGARTGMLACVLFALNTCTIAISQEARAYSFVVLAVIVATYCFVRLVEAPSYGRAITYGLVAGATCYFHYFGVLVPAAHALSLIAAPRATRAWKQYLVAAIIIVLLAIPVLWLIHAQDVGHISWVQAPSVLELYHLGVFLAANGGKAVGAVLLALDLVLIGFFLRNLRSVWRDGDDVQRWRYGLVASSFFAPIVITLAVSIVRPAFYHRFLVICLPAWIMMTAVGAQQIRRHFLRTSAIGVVCVLSLASTVIGYVRVTEDWRGAVGYLISQARPGDRALYYQSLGNFAVENYWGWLAGDRAPYPAGVGVNPSNSEWEKQLDRAPRVWLVLYRAKPDDPESRVIEQELVRNYDARVEKVFRGVAVIGYESKR